MSDNEWSVRAVGTAGLPAGVSALDVVEYRLDNEPAVYDDEARSIDWRDGPGAVTTYRVISQRLGGVGDVNGTTPGSAARFNAGKPRLDLIPAWIIGAVASRAPGPLPMPSIQWSMALARLGDFQMQHDGRDALLHVLQIIDNDGNLWADCAAVFEYGLHKYGPWNWARGQAWSIPIGAALRHIVFGLPCGPLDAESGLPHRGHVACNIVMLLWFLDHYPDGDDRYAPPVGVS